MTLHNSCSIQNRNLEGPGEVGRTQCVVRSAAFRTVEPSEESQIPHPVGFPEPIGSRYPETRVTGVSVLSNW